VRNGGAPSDTYLRDTTWTVADDERELCVQYAPRIRAFGLRHLRDASDADDLVQHVLLAVLSALRAGRIEDPSRIGAYVIGTCRNAVMDMRRGVARQRRVAERDAAGKALGYIPAWDAVDHVHVERCLGELEARDRTVVLSSFLEDKDADEIARVLETTAGNVRVIRHRALARLHDCLERCA